MHSARSYLLSGVKAELPILIGVIPFGMIYGVLALGAGLIPGEAQAMSVIVFAGSAQFLSTQLISSSTPGLMVVLSVAIINLRHALYSASIAPHLSRLSKPWKWLLAYLLTDEAYAVSIVFLETPMTQIDRSRLEGEDPLPGSDYRHWYLLGAGLALWTTWQLSTAAGIYLGAVIPSSWSLDFALVLTFIALAVPIINDRASLGAALAAGVVAVLAHSLPFNLSLVIAAITGILVGLWLEARR